MKFRESILRQLSAGLSRPALAAALLAASTSGHAIDFGPDGMFSLTGFGQILVGQQGNYCLNCQVTDSNGPKHVRANDAIKPGIAFGTAGTVSWQVQPYLSAKYNLGKGYEISALLSQRWRDGTIGGTNTETRYGGLVDMPDFWYEKNIALRHEEYGSIRIGAMTSRAWSSANYPYGSNFGMSDAWGASGAGYGFLSSAIRFGSPNFDVADGNLYFELTYDQGNTNFTRLKPSFYELYAQYHKGELELLAMYQDATNGAAGAWGKTPFSGVTPFVQDDSFTNATNGVRFGENKQSILMAMGRYQYSSAVELTGGIRRNMWSGANLVFNPGTQGITAFNVDYSNPFAASNPGFPASSVDYLLGARYRTGLWTFSTGMVYLGKADTANPTERGQSNSALINTLGVRYQYSPALIIEGIVGFVNYSKQGLSPMSMPGNASFTNVDSRVTTSSSWMTFGATYSF